MDDFPKIAGNLFANKSLLFLWIVSLLPMSPQKFPYLPVVRNFFSREWWWFSLAIGPMDHARENGARETPRGWQRSCHSLVPKRLTLFNGKRMWNIGSGTKTESWHFTPLQSGGNYIICDMYYESSRGKTTCYLEVIRLSKITVIQMSLQRGYPQIMIHQ